MEKKTGKKFQFTTIMLCRAGIIAALYVVLTMPFGELAFGVFQIRPSEALTILPLFYPEAVAGLYAGCMIANAASEFGLLDIFLGSLATLVAALGTYAAGRIFKNHALRLAVGGIFPVLANAFIVPAVWLLAQMDIAYWYQFACFILNESVWVYALGIPLYFFVHKAIKRNVRAMMPLSLRVKNKQNNIEKCTNC